MKTRVDLNSDMGEGFGPWRIGDGVDEQIMPLISSANIATGFHAGDPNITGLPGRRGPDGRRRAVAD